MAETDIFEYEEMKRKADILIADGNMVQIKLIHTPEGERYQITGVKPKKDTQ